jgi:hypothetical protein
MAENGWNDDFSTLSLYDPVSGETKTINDVAYEDRLKYNPSRGLTAWGYDPDGNRVLMDTSNPDWQDYTYRDQTDDKQGGAQVGSNPNPPITGGGGGFTTGGGLDDPFINRDTNVGPNGEDITINPFDPAAPIPNGNEAAIRGLYQELFGRAPAQAGLDYWLGENIALPDLRQALINGALGADLDYYNNKFGDQPPVTPTPTPTPPISPTPTPTPGDDEPPIAPVVPNTSTDLPVPPGGPTGPWTGTGEQADTSWNWDAFAPKSPGDGAWGGYDQDYQAFERYQPGMDSPWGMPDVMGGNESFYQQQFVNQLRDEQGFQNRERSAQMRRQEAAENPYEAAPIDWSWANNGQGLPTVETAGGTADNPTMSQYGLRDPFVAGETTNREIYDAAMAAGWIEPNNNYGDLNQDHWDTTSWSESSQPSDNYGDISAGSDPTWLDMQKAGMNYAFTNNQVQTPTGGGPTASPGYALPVSMYG